MGIEQKGKGVTRVRLQRQISRLAHKSTRQTYVAYNEREDYEHRARHKIRSCTVDLHELDNISVTEALATGYSAHRFGREVKGMNINTVVAKIALLICAITTFVSHQSLGQEASKSPNAAATQDASRTGYLIDVPLPLLGSRDEVILRQIEDIANHASQAEQRPVVVLRFAAEQNKEKSTTDTDASVSETRGTQFERGLALARYLTSPAMAKVRLVAYLPEPVEGHAVLPVLACESIVAKADAELGRASIDEPVVDETVRGAYRDIVRRRGTMNEAAVGAMLDVHATVVKIESSDGQTLIVSGDEAKQLRAAGKVIREETLWTGGSLASFTGSRMRQLGWIDRVVDNEDSLRTAVGVTGRLAVVRPLPATWVAGQIELSGWLSTEATNRIIRTLAQRTVRGTTESANLAILRFQDVHGAPSEALRLAAFIRQLANDGVYTAAVIEVSASDAALLPAFACDRVFLVQSARLGSQSTNKVDDTWLTAGTKESILGLEKSTNRPASLMTATIDPDISVKSYVHQDTGTRRVLAEWQREMLPDEDSWIAQDVVSEGGEVDSAKAMQYGLVDSQVEDFAAATRALGLSKEPASLEGPWIENAIQGILAREWLPRLLITIGFMALMIEVGSPGLGLGGLVAALCFVGFFWIEGLNGNVAWLEVLMFVGGAIALAIELFVIPGFGIFGISGILMVLGSLVLASQTFIFPTDSEQLTIVANNLFWIAVCAVIVMVGVVFMGKRLENTSAIRWLKIEPASADDVADLEHREAIVHWEHLLGQDGMTTTRLNPAGKAQFGRMIVSVLGTDLIDEGVAVRVVEVRGNSVFVEPIE